MTGYIPGPRVLLHSGVYMYLVSVDPSGSPDPPKSNNLSETLFVIAGLVMRDSNLDAFEDSMRRLLLKHIGNYDVELHAKDISSRRGIYYNIDTTQLNTLFHNALLEGLKYIDVIIAVVIEKSHFRNIYAKNLPRDDFRLRVTEYAFRNLLERLLWWNYENGCTNYMLLILDDQAFGRLRGQERAYRSFIINELRHGYYISKLPCRKIFPIAAFADSAQFRLIQLADLVTWVIRRIIYRPQHAFLNVVEFTKIIKQKIRQRQNRRIGYGIKLIPDNIKDIKPIEDRVRNFFE